MKIAYLHIGLPEHGICRYGRLLAAEANKRQDICVMEASVILTDNRKHNELMFKAAARQLFNADIVHIQYSLKNNKKLWGKGWKLLYYLWLFKHHCRCKFVVTLHDIYDVPSTPKALLKNLHIRGKTSISSQSNSFSNPLHEHTVLKSLIIKKGIRYIKSMYNLDILSLRLLLNYASITFVCSKEEANRLKTIVNDNKIGVIPHFVEQRSLDINRVEVRRKLKLDKWKTVTLLGFIHGRKGHRLLIEALPNLPQDVKVIFAGGASTGNEGFVEELLTLAKQKAVDNRLQITGYLSESELEQYLVATDLAVCPFQFFSASGSMSTWISAKRPILASDLPQIAEYNSIESNAIQTFTPYCPTSLATAIQHFLESDNSEDNPAIARLKERLSIREVFEKHLSYYSYVTNIHL